MTVTRPHRHAGVGVDPFTNRQSGSCSCMSASVCLLELEDVFHRLIEEYPDAARLIENRIRDNLAELAAKAASQFYRFS